MARLIWDHPGNEGRRGRALAAAAAWQLYKRVIRAPRTMTVYDGVRFRAHPDSTEPGRYLYYGGWPDWAEMAFIRHYLRPGDHFVDGGAHEGMYALLAASLVGEGGRVDAFEAAPLALTRLCDNVARNGFSQVRVHAVALSDREGDVEFVIDRRAGSGNRMRTADDGAAATVVASARTLDGALPAGSRVAMVKLDVEGAEPLVLLGAARLLVEHPPPVWQLELVDRFTQRFGWSADDVARWADERGYDVATYDPVGRQLRDAPEAVGTSRDVLLVHRSARDEVAARVASG